VQVAAAAGVSVIAPALAEDEDYLRGLGAAELIDRDGDVPALVRERRPGGVDALLDLASYAPALSTTHKHGKLAIEFADRQT
jgi:NADPH2:quinone reductase